MRNKLLKILSIIIVFSVFILPSESYPQTEKTYGLAVLDLEGNNIAEAEAKALSDVLRSSINKILLEKSGKVKDSYELLERSQMDNIFDQFDVQNTGCTDLSCAIEFGKMLNVDRIIIGSVSLIGSTYMVIARIVDVESSKTIVSVDRKQRGIIDNVIDLMPVVGHELLTGEHLTAPVPAALSPSTTVKTPAVPADSRQVQRQQEQYISVSGTPEAAEVFLNDEKIGETPIDYRKVNLGRYLVKISGKRHENFEDEIIIAPGANEKIFYKLTPYAVLDISGSPEGAAVYVNGKEAGRTPVIGYALPKGTYSINIIHKGFSDYEQSITLYSGKKREVRFDLTALEAISVEGMPSGAVITVKGKKIGEAPVDNYIVPEGSYKVKILSPGYENYVETVNISEGIPAKISYNLKPKTKQGVLKRSIFLHGSGQRYAEYRGKGNFITILQLAAIGGAAAASLNAGNAWSEYDDADAAPDN